MIGTIKIMTLEHLVAIILICPVFCAFIFVHAKQGQHQPLELTFSEQQVHRLTNFIDAHSTSTTAKETVHETHTKETSHGGNMLEVTTSNNKDFNLFIF